MAARARGWTSTSGARPQLTVSFESFSSLLTMKGRYARCATRPGDRAHRSRLEDPGAQSGNRGDGHAENHDWYRTLKTKSGWSCCSGDEGHGDCRPVQAHQRQDGEWEAYFDGSWQEIPPDAILRDELNRVPLHAHICERAGFVYCFLRGGGGS
jgi:hypothetical protein